MDYKYIGREKGKFLPRKSKEEFFCDGQVIKDLFCWTDCLICEELNIPFHDYMLDVFNNAYHICQMIVGEMASVWEINASISFRDDTVRKYSWAVAYAILRLHENFYSIEDSIYRDFSWILPESFYATNYSSFVHEKSLTYPLEFSILFRYSTHEPELEKEMDFGKAKSLVMDVMNKAVKLQGEYEELRDTFNVVNLEVIAYKNKIKELQEQNDLLMQKVNKLENDELCKVVNLETIVKYGLRQTEPQIVKVVTDMLSRLCVGKGCVPEPLQKRIEDLEDHIVELKKPQPNIQNNHGCQQFYGNVAASEFHS